MRVFVIILFSLLVGGAIGFFVGYDIGFEKAPKIAINSFEDCVAAGYPVQESFPERCTTADGKNFVKDTDKLVPPTEPGTVCTTDAKLCPDGSSVGRVPPSCEFPACPGE